MTLLLIVPARAQDDRYVDDLEKVFEALGGKNSFKQDGGWKRFLRHRARYDREIKAAVPLQDKAVAGNMQEKRDSIALYESRSRSRGEPLDHYLHGRILGLSGELERAAVAFKRALESEIYFFWAWDGLGVYYMNKKEMRRAVECFEKAVLFEPGFTKAALALTQCLAKSGQVATAQLRLNELLAKKEVREDAESVKVLTLLLADIFREQKEWARMVEVLNPLVDREVKDIRPRAMRALAYRRLELWSEAAGDYRELTDVAASPGQQARFWGQVGECMQRLGRNADAADAYQKAIDIPENGFQAEMRTRMQQQVERLRKRPRVEDPKKQQLGLKDWIQRLKNSADVKKRREAIRFLANAPLTLRNRDVVEAIGKAFFGALLDTDYIVRAKALEQIGKRFLHEDTMALPIQMLKSEKEHRLVRGMAAHVLPNWRSPRAVPPLMNALSADDAYVFKQVHSSLNCLTMAWIDVVLHDDFGRKDMAQIRKKWDAWYQKNRDRYRRYEKE